MPVSEKTFKQVALEDPEGHWELHCGQLTRKPGMSYDHNEVATRLLVSLVQQLDPSAFGARHNAGHVRRSSESYYIPDVFVFPKRLAEGLRGRIVLESYTEPLPLVVEVWSPSTGDYDIEVKLLEYQRRGDLEIWRIHPYDRTLTAWRRQSDGSYAESVCKSGVIHPVALPDVTINLDSLFE
jgi:Uma2 family endonuclease